MGSIFRAAVIQAGSVVMDREATTAKAVRLIKEAGAKGAGLVLLPEAFIPAYPRGLALGSKIGSRSPQGRQDWLRYWQNCVAVPSETTAALAAAAREAAAYVCVGVVERDADHGGGTLYCTILYFGPDGAYLGKHRKLKPTASERLIWGEGDGSTLTVVDTPHGRIGGLICWENYMPLARTAMYEKGVHIYLAPTADQRERWQATVRHIALEGRCFVLSCNQFVTKSMYPRDLACYDELAGEPEILSRGGSAIISPFGEYLVEPVWDREEILITDLDMSFVPASKFDFDAVGHYARSDVFRLTVDETRR
ncbi:MAG: carbon-nitrogen hydrolase family protein [Bacillota bacterium]|nr:carbon-nitrogen hydrolase family protein [Bacillota bacterium]